MTPHSLIILVLALVLQVCAAPAATSAAQLPPIVLPPTLLVPQIGMNGTSVRVANISSEVYYRDAPWDAVAGCDPSQASLRSRAGAKAVFVIEVDGDVAGVLISHTRTAQQRVLGAAYISDLTNVSASALPAFDPASTTSCAASHMVEFYPAKFGLVPLRRGVVFWLLPTDAPTFAPQYFQLNSVVAYANVTDLHAAAEGYKATRNSWPTYTP